MADILLAVLIPHLTDRKPYLDRLLAELKKQADKHAPGQVEFFVSEDKGERRLGAKRNDLIAQAAKANAKAVAFFDDDDLPGKHYISENIKGILSGADCCSLWGNIYFGRRQGKPFHHSVKYKKWYEDQRNYYRCPNHLNATLLKHVIDVPYPEQDFGEDGVQSEALAQTGRLQNEYAINHIIYHYFTGDKDWDWQNEYFQKHIA